MTVPQIAEELGRSEATIRNHLTKKTKAGQLV
jgi:predicted transcriptional regulator